MDKFVDAVKNWVGFELFLNTVGIIALLVSGINAGKYLSQGLMLIYIISLLVLFVRMAFMISVIHAGKPENPLPAGDNYSEAELEEMGVK